MGKKSRIRPIAICLFRHNNRFLVYEGDDPVKGIRFARPLGGGIEFGEHSRETAIREIREELGAEITDIEFVCMMESIYIYLGEPGHELVFVYDARFVDESLYTQEVVLVNEGERQFEARWRSLEELKAETILLVPEGLEKFV